jgi:hypothetical protein
MTTCLLNVHQVVLPLLLNVKNLLVKIRFKEEELDVVFCKKK